MELSAQAIIENLVEHHAQVEAQLRYQIVRQQVHIAALEARLDTPPEGTSPVTEPEE